MKFCWALPVVRTHETQRLIEAYIDHSLRAEGNHFDAVLVSLTPDSLDPFVIATKIGMDCKNIELLIAQNTNHILPTYTAKALNTLNAIVGPRASLNIVTGSSKITLSKDQKPIRHAERYVRTREFTEILQQLRQGTTTYDGDFFSIISSDIYPAEDSCQPASYFVAGSSQEAQEVAAKYGDVYIMYASDFSTVERTFENVRALAKQHGRDIQCALLIDVIARKTSEEAWQVAEQLVANTPEQIKRLTKVFLKSVDSVGLGRYRDFGANDLMIDETLWAGLNKINPSNSISSVGSYAEVTSTLKRFHNMGANYFILTCINGDEIENIGQNVIARLKSF